MNPTHYESISVTWANVSWVSTQQAFTPSGTIIEPPGKYVKSVQN